MIVKSAKKVCFSSKCKPLLLLFFDQPSCSFCTSSCLTSFTKDVVAKQQQLDFCTSRDKNHNGKRPKQQFNRQFQSPISKDNEKGSHFAEHSIKTGALPNVDQVRHSFKDKIQRLTKTLVSTDSKRAEISAQLLRLRQPLVEKLARHLCSGGSQLVLVGSLATGLAVDAESDLDLVYLFSKPRLLQVFWRGGIIKRRQIMLPIMEKLVKICATDPEMRLAEKPECIPHSYVPIVRCKFANGLTMEMQFPRPNFQALQNTIMVRRFVATDPRFPQLFHWLKRVFTEMGVRNSKAGLFSSYQILTLVLHFLNRPQVPANVLPLNNNVFPSTWDGLNAILQQLQRPVQPMKWTSGCEKEAGELAMELVDYWARFNPSTTQIHIGSGRTALKDSNSNPVFSGRWVRNSTLLIYEPCEPLTICRPYRLAEVLRVSFGFLHSRISRGLYIDDFPGLDGLADDFSAHVNKLEWARLLKKRANANLGHMEDGLQGIVEEEGKK